MTMRIGTTLRVAIALLLFIGLCAPFEAATSVVDPSTGRILMVEVISDPTDPSIQGIRYRERWPQGTTSEENVTGTMDPILDEAPSITLNPVGGVVVVWSRHDGSDFELVLTRRENGSWSGLRTLTDNTGFDTRPQTLIASPDVVHIAWWGNGSGGPFYLQSYDVLTGAPVSPRYEPINMRRFRPRRVTSDGTSDDAGGMDEPGIPTINGNYAASAVPCTTNPAAAPDHGVVMACGNPGAFQLSGCELVVGVPSATSGTWQYTAANLSSTNLQSTSVREIVQSIADYNCNR